MNSKMSDMPNFRPTLRRSCVPLAFALLLVLFLLPLAGCSAGDPESTQKEASSAAPSSDDSDSGLEIVSEDFESGTTGDLAAQEGEDDEEDEPEG